MNSLEQASRLTTSSLEDNSLSSVGEAPNTELPGEPTEQAVPVGNLGEHVSKDGKWRTHQNWPAGLLQYIPTGVYFGRIKYKGESIRRSLETTVYRQAVDRLHAYLKDWKKEIDHQIKGKCKVQPTTWEEAQALFLKDSHDKAVRRVYMWRTVEQHQTLAGKIVFIWPSVKDRTVSDISQPEVLEFFTEAAGGTGRFAPAPYLTGYGKKAGVYKRSALGPSQYNIIKWIGAQITNKAIAADVAKGLPAFQNPWLTIEDMAVDQSPPDLPSNEEFAAILHDILNAPRSGRCTGGLPITRDHVYVNWACTKFLGMFGARIGEVLGGTSRHHPNDPRHPGLTWKNLHEDAVPPYVNIHNEKKRRKRKNWREIRTVPCVSAGSVEFLKELRARCYRGNPEALVFEGVSREYGINLFLKTTCKRLAFKRVDTDGTERVLGISQKDLRHYFITACIEAGATFLAISRWVGHASTKYIDEVYGHLRPEYSFGMTAKVNVLPPSKPAHIEKLRIDGKDYTMAELECKIAAADLAANGNLPSPLVSMDSQEKVSESGVADTLGTGANPKNKRKQVIVNGVVLTEQQVNQLKLDLLEAFA